MSDKVKYIHIMRSELKFSTNLLKMFVDQENKFNIDDHLFVFTSEEIYNELKKIGVRILLVTNCSEESSIINYFGDKCDWIFLHGISHRYLIHKIKRDFRSKIVWRTWGHDSFRDYRELLENNFIKGVVKCLYNYFVYYRVLNSFHEVGIANSVDEVSLKKANIHLPQVRIGYPAHEKLFLDYQRLISDKKNDGILRVLIGHSGHESDRHKYVIDMVKKFKGCNVLFYIVLSYGDSGYISEIEQYANKILSSNVVIVKEYMHYEDYICFLNHMDIGIFAGSYSYALGNVTTLLRLQKTIYLNYEGILAEAFRLENIPFIDIREISKMNFREFSNTLNFTCDPSWSLLPVSYEERVKHWKICLDDLEHN